MGRKSESGGAKPAGDRIELTFMFQGKRLRPTLDLRPTEPNMKHARRMVAAIKSRIAIGAFDLEKEFPDYKFKGKHVVAPEPVRTQGVPTFTDAADLYEDLMLGDQKHASASSNRRILAQLWRPKLGARPIADILDIDVLQIKKDMEADAKRAGKKIAPNTWNNKLAPLRAVFEVAVSKRWIPESPLRLIKNRKRQTALPDPFNVDEVQELLAACDNRYGQVMADYWDFAFAQGLRPSEQIELKWTMVDLRRREIKVDRARVWGVANDSTKTNVERIIKLKPRAWAVIERQRARTQLMPTGHVFLNPVTTEPWSSDKKLHDWWNRIMKPAGIRYRKPYVTRQTSVSFRLMIGENALLVAEEHGHSVQTMLDDYARWARPSNDEDWQDQVARIKAWFEGFASDLPVEIRQSS